jgi:hypothetical protein
MRHDGASFCGILTHTEKGEIKNILDKSRIVVILQINGVVITNDREF